MAEKPGYWDVHLCRWVGAEPENVLPSPVRAPADRPASSDEAAVPEQRPAAERAMTADAPD